MSGLGKLPPYDGAPLNCSHHDLSQGVQRCDRPAAGLLSWEQMAHARRLGISTMRAVCGPHGVEVLTTLELDTPDDDE